MASRASLRSHLVSPGFYLYLKIVFIFPAATGSCRLHGALSVWVECAFAAASGLRGLISRPSLLELFVRSLLLNEVESLFYRQ